MVVWLPLVGSYSVLLIPINLAGSTFPRLICFQGERPFFVQEVVR